MRFKCMIRVCIFQCSTLEVIGGRDGIETIHQLLDKIISHEFSLVMNWSGRNDKVAFSVYGNIMQLITGNFTF